MKARRRSTPLDSVCLEQGQRLIHIHTHRQTIILSAYEDEGRMQVAHHEFTFDQLFALIEQLRPDIQRHVITQP